MTMPVRERVRAYYFAQMDAAINPWDPLGDKRQIDAFIGSVIEAYAEAEHEDILTRTVLAKMVLSIGRALYQDVSDQLVAGEVVRRGFFEGVD